MTMMQMIVIGVLILADIATGLVKALYNHDYNSSIMREGAYHKFCEICVIALSIGADKYLPTVGVNLGISLAPVVITYFALMECTSILENIGSIYPDAIKPITKYFAKLNGGEHNGSRN